MTKSKTQVFEVYHSPEQYSFTLIDQAKKEKQNHLLEDDAILIDTFSYEPVSDDEDINFDNVKKIYNQCIKKYNDNGSS